MSNSLRTVLIVVGIVVLLGAAFYGGIVYQNAKGGAGDGAVAAGRPNGPAGGGPMPNLTAEEQAELEGMTDEERQAFMQERFGGQMPGGSAPTGAGRGMGGGLVEGEVIEVADDTITIKLDSGSSQTVYTDDDTVIAKAEGAADLAVGSGVFVAATPEADGVTTASVIVVKQ
jgi:hypothetical protein